jgi:hypothetical protein
MLLMPVNHLSVDLQPRDFALLRELLESRVLSINHAALLHFSGKNEFAKKRIAKLKNAGFIAERPRRQFEPSILYLTGLAFQALADHGHLADYPNLGMTKFEKRAKVSDLKIRHELAVMDIKVAVANSIAGQPPLHLHQFWTWPRLYEFAASTVIDGFRAKPGTIQPDGYIRVSEQTVNGAIEHAFFLEVDRTTESLGKLAARAVAYLDYYRSGGFAVWRGADRDQYKQYPFRVLGVFLSETRMRNFALRLVANNPPIRHQFLLASLSDAIRDPFGAIWTTPADYAAGTEPTPRELFVSAQGKAEHAQWVALRD